MKRSPSSSERALTSLRLDLPVTHRPASSSTSAKPASVEAFLAHLGDPGRFQIVVMILLATNCIPVVVNHLLMAFYAVQTPHNCRIPKELIGTRNKSHFFPLNDNGDGLSQCLMFKDFDNHTLGTQPCLDGYEFAMENTKEWNVVAEWGLVCERAFIGPLLTTVYFSGVMLGGLIFGSLSDRFGRKNMCLLCLYTQCLIGIGLHFVRRLLVFMGLRFIQGIFIQGLQCVTFSLVMELFSPRYRTLAGCVIEAFWALGVILLAIIAKYVQHWRYIQLSINIPTLATIFYIWIIPESIRWLMSKNKVKRAEHVVIKIASYNSVRLDRSWLREELNEVVKGLHGADEQTTTSSEIRDGVKNRRIRINAMVMFFVWFSVSLSYYGISYSIPNLSGDRYLNFMIGGGIELAAYLLAFVILNSFGRKYPLMIYLLLSGVLCIGTVVSTRFIPSHVVDTEALTIGFALVGKAAVVSCFCAIFIYSNEIFPTVIRTFSVGACTFFGRVGSLLAPQILLLGRYLWPESPEVVAFLAFGVLSLVAGVLVLFLPETHNQNLPDTVTQATAMAQTGRHESTGSLLEDKFETNEAGYEELAAYGKSPEWVEVDGMIVSKGILGPNQDSNRNLAPGSGDSVVSMSNSNKTALTDSSRSKATEEPPYESLPHFDLSRGQATGRIFDNPLPPVPQGQDSIQDVSVTSAHNSGIYDFIVPDSSYSLKHQLLTSNCGAETRL